MLIVADTYRTIPFGRVNPHAKLRFKVSYRIRLFKWPGKVLAKLAGEVMDTMLEAYRDP